MRIHLTFCVHFFCRYAFPIKCTEVILGENKDSVLEIRAEYDPDKKSKPKVFIMVIIRCEVSPFPCCLHLLNSLFSRGFFTGLPNLHLELNH